MIFILCFGLLFASILAPIFLARKENFIIKTTQLFMLAALVLISIYAVKTPNELITYSWQALNFNHLNLTLAVQFDALTKIMMIFILLIGFFIYRYAQNYLEGDQTRIRFLSQLNLVVCSVLLLVMAANLLTAFVAWQLIGANLYLLLNHYHKDPAANRAAKKKFVINRIGDSSFLLAIVLAYHSHSAVSFAAIQTSPHAELICALIFISVMTKCAQFPFHIWLIDTLETPTPVSALMHTGVINAGGILLTRISGTLVLFHGLAYFVLFIGLVSAVLSIQWMNQQPDVKKKLAYSTMGQMGYMLAQCGLGAFPAAIFHLMSHGFYKASLFLNSGETLKQPKSDEQTSPLSYQIIIKSTLIALVIFCCGILLFHNFSGHIPLLMYGFILLTLITLISKVELVVPAHWAPKSMYYLIITAMFFAYLLCFHLFSSLLTPYDYSHSISLGLQIILTALLFAGQLFLWRNKQQLKRIRFKDNTEFFLRRYLLNPLRSLGSVLTIHQHKKATYPLYIITMALTVAGLVYGLLTHGFASQEHAVISHWLVFSFLIVGILTLVAANRCLSIKSLIIYLALFELAFSNLAWFDGSLQIIKIGYFHLITISTVLLMLALLARKSKTPHLSKLENNRLPTRAFYLTFSLLLLIGIPGTSSFVSEFYLMSALVNDNALFILMYISLIVLLAIVVMHSLQLYAFNKNYASLLTKPISLPTHCLFLAVIAVNIAFGLFPNLLLGHL